MHLVCKENNSEYYPFKKNVFQFKDSLQLYRQLAEIKEDLISKGYWSASIDSIVKSGTVYYAYLFIGKQYNLKLSTGSILPDALKAAKIKNKTFSDNKTSIVDYLQKRKALLEYFENIGYPFAEITIDKPFIQNNYLSGNLIINPKQKFYFDTIYIKSKFKIAQKLVYRQIGIKPGDVFSGESLAQIDQNIQKMTFAGLQKPSELEFFHDKVDLYVYLKKQKSNFFSGMLGFASDIDKPNRLLFTGNIRLDLNNSFGIGENIHLQWESYADSSQYLLSGLRFPYLFFVPLGLSAGFELDKTSLDYLNINYSFSMSYDFSPENGISIYFRRKQSFLINNDQNSNFADADNYILGMNLRVDNTNRLFVPREGYKISISSGYGTRNTEQNPKESIVEAQFAIVYYWFVNKYFNILLKNNSKGIFNNEGFYENELFKLGGINTVRGFDEKSLISSAYTIFTIEPRFFIGNYSYLSVFADYVYFNTLGIEVKSSNSGIGIGTGISINTKAGMLRLNFAVGSLNGNTFQLSNTKVHIGYVARF